MSSRVSMCKWATLALASTPQPCRSGPRLHACRQRQDEHPRGTTAAYSTSPNWLSWTWRSGAIFFSCLLWSTDWHHGLSVTTEEIKGVYGWDAFMLLFYDLQSESLALKLHRVSGVYRFSFFNFYVLYERPPYVLSSVAAFFHNNFATTFSYFQHYFSLWSF